MKLILFCFVLYFVSPNLVSGQISKFCSKDADCKVEFSSCMNGLCVCESGKVFSSYGDKCLDIAPGLGFPCQDSFQCAALILGPSACNEKELCGCDNGYMFLDNKCVKYMGMNETCTEDTPCYDGVDLFAMSCIDKKCVCNDGYYMRGEYDCRRSAEVDGVCFFDVDCENEDQYCKFKYGPAGNCTDAPNIACKTTKDCEKQLNNSFCAPFRQNKCTCKDGFIYDKEEEICVEEVIEEPEENLMKINIPDSEINIRGALDKACTNDNECKDIKNSFCPKFRSKCTCKDTFIYDRNTGNCVKGLGTSCVKTADLNVSECAIKHSFCNEDNVCQCPKYFIYSPFNDKCHKPTREFQLDSCGSDENCYSFGSHAICSANNNLTITCTCKSNSKYDENLKYCVPMAFGNGCKYNCKYKPHSECVASDCVCNEHYVEEDLKCLPDLDYPCSLAGAGDCVIDNAECVLDTKICQCKKGYFKNGDRQCVKFIEDPNENCEMDIQCINFLDEGGICFNETCTCSSTYVFDEIENKCESIRSIGDQCQNKRHCQTMTHSEHVRCLRGACICDYDYHFSEELSKCVADNGASAIEGRQLIFLVVLVITTLLFFW